MSIDSIRDGALALTESERAEDCHPVSVAWNEVEPRWPGDPEPAEDERGSGECAHETIHPTGGSRGLGLKADQKQSGYCTACEALFWRPMSGGDWRPLDDDEPNRS